MFGRRVAEAIRPRIVPQGGDAARGGEKRMDNLHRHAGEADRRTCRHEDALVATNRRRCLRRTARHVACHLVRRVRGGHVIRYSLHLIQRRHVGRHPRHDGPGNRSQRKARDHQDREQPAYGDVPFHNSNISQNCGEEKIIHHNPCSTTGRRFASSGNRG
jgi:hypothetical protein